MGLAQHLVIVFGASAAGKSTFLNHLKAGCLQKDLVDRLPADCPKWPVVNAADHWQWIPQIINSNRDDLCLIMHFDVTRLSQLSTDGEANDHALMACKFFQTITVVSIQPTSLRLLAQFVRRSDDRLTTKLKLYVLLLAERTCPTASFFRMLARALIHRHKSMPPRTKDILLLYSQDSIVKSLDEIWRTQLSLHASPGQIAREINLMPASALGADPRWFVTHLIDYPERR